MPPANQPSGGFTPESTPAKEPVTLPAETQPTTMERPAVEFLFGRLNYERVVSVPYQEQNFKLDRMFDLAARLGNPQDELTIVHVAGSKGKGSTSTMVASMLMAAGYKIGLYTSPHLVEPEERIQINLQNCPPAIFDQLLLSIEPHVNEMDRQIAGDSEQRGPTYFEILTAAALVHFQHCQVDVAVIEVGLGGRLDSTNICQPACSVITTISKDHTRQLGDTLEKIAYEKAGIIKLQVPVVSGVLEQAPQEVIHEKALAENASVSQRGRDFEIEPTTDGQFAYVEPATDAQPTFRIERLRTGMLGSHQLANAAVAIRALRLLSNCNIRVDEAAIREGLRTAKCNGRIEVASTNPLTIVDAAHNEASAAALAKTLQAEWPHHQVIFILAATRGKDVAGILRHLVPLASRMIFTKYLDVRRCFDPEKLRQMARETASELGFAARPSLVKRNPAEAWRAAQRVAASDEGDQLICITGSFFLASELRPLVIESDREIDLSADQP
jgi:dihydrofolate synthase/folylpolyglutamate synthase